MPAARGDRGFALLIVLWVLVLLALIVAQLGVSGRQEAKIARNLMGNAQAEAAADGAVYQAIFHLSDATDPSWQADGLTRHLTVGAVPVEVHIEDEAGKISPNLGDPALLQALFLILGADQRQAQLVAQSIVEWRGGTPVEQQPAIIQRYQAAGLKAQPTFVPFESLDDVALVQGMTPELAALARPHLSVYQIGLFDPTRADPIVVRALSQLPGGSIPAAPTVAPAYRSLSVVASATAADGARFTRRTVVRIGPGLPHGYALLTWEAPEG